MMVSTLARRVPFIWSLCHEVSRMVDKLTSSQRSSQMARVRSKDTAPEIAVRRALHARGLRFRLHRKDLPGRPDVVLPRHRMALFVHGCFWHGCPRCDRGLRRPQNNATFWEQKLEGNRARDVRNKAALESLGWQVETVWECDVRDPARLTSVLDGLFASVRI